VLRKLPSRWTTTESIRDGFNLPLVGRALNHSQVSTTARYVHLSLDPVRAALEQTAALMVGK
jgi:site-specific recombinase XerD